MDTEQRILKMLEESGISLTIQEAAEKADIHTITARKCLEKLCSEGAAEKRIVAGVALYTIKGRERGII